TVSFPGIVTELAWTWNRVEPPQAFAAGRIISVDETAHSKLRTGDAGDNSISQCERGHRAAKTLHVVGHLGFPKGQTTLGIESHQVTVSGSEEYSPAEHGHTPVHLGGVVRVYGLAPALILPQRAA